MRTINLTPVGMQTPEGCERVAKAQCEWEHSTAEVANLAGRFIKALNERGGMRIPNDLADDMEELTRAIEDRDAKQEEFLRSIAGAPPAAA